MKLQILDEAFSVCKINDAAQIDLSAEFCFIFKTDKERVYPIRHYISVADP